MARLNGSVGTTRGFVKAINKWTLETEERSTDAFREGSKDFYDELWRETPVDTGNLRNSLKATKSGSAASQSVTGPGTGQSAQAESYMVIDSLELGDRVSLVYQATYARRLNLGFVGFDKLGRYYNQSGKFWIERVGARYRSIMRAAATRLRG